MPDIHKSAFVAVVGRPSAGKSTLVNTICGQKVAIVSPVPQTTRNTIRGIKTGEGYQLVFLDTPGLHDSEKTMNRRLRDLAVHALQDADLVLYVMDTTRAPGAEEESIAKRVAPFAGKTLIAINKIDDRESDIARTRLFLAEHIADASAFDVSAEKGTGVDAIVAALAERAPLGPAYYPAEFYTDQEPVFRIAETIREKVFLHTRNEVPHAVYVEYQSHHMLDDGTLVYEGDLVVERETQKGILIGAGGSMIRLIREEAEHDLAEIFDYPVRLSIKVRVQNDWKKDDKVLKRLIQ
ncbi:MAG: GTPase Era [Spirochaetia bacterium]|jgi:GTP-binding protein Era|nr:GTPase Era [Spirochaetia bacterium]